ncbi:MAG: yhhT [Chitinophagaceae bacterium]|nr:yhhT [Chitinophagaceae bacterium]
MDNTLVRLPVYSKLAQIVIGVVAFFYVLYIGQDIIIPLVFATIIAILLNPLVNLLCRKKINRVLAIFIALFIGIIVIAGVGYFIGSQMTMFSESFPQFKEKFIKFSSNAESWISHTFNISKTKIDSWLTRTRGEGMNNSTAVITETLGTITGVLVTVFLLPVYIFMILFYKPLLLDFISQLFKKDQHAVVAEVLLETKTLIQSYLVGLLFEAVLVATLNAVGLLIIGIDYAILLGVIGALLNIIPYIGGVIAIALPMLIAFATKTPVDALWVLVVYLIVQFIDNNFFVPKIVASKVKINALVSIIVVLIGNVLWGIPGMFLSIPITAILKVIFDRIEPLKPFGFLLGDNQPDLGKTIFTYKKPRKKK